MVIYHDNMDKYGAYIPVYAVLANSLKLAQFYFECSFVFRYSITQQIRSKMKNLTSQFSCVILFLFFGN